MNSTQTHSGFNALSVASNRCATLLQQGISEPTPIQRAAIPIAMGGSDLIGIAQTGTGKTLAFGLPMAENLSEGKTGLVLAPTRELAQQIAETLMRIGLRSAVVVGGASMHLQTKQLRSNPQVIVATPGRLIDHLERGTIRLGRVAIVVLDEADRMLDMGFAPAIKKILDQAPSQRQTLLFSATMPKEIEELASSYLRAPQRVEVSPAGTAPELVDQEVVYVEFEQKYETVENLLHEFGDSVLVFTRTRHGARKLAKSIRTMGHSAAEIHSDRTLNQRMEAMNGFKVGKYRVLVATDIAARGIDVKGISLVLNYDVPEHADDYVHRIGRTGRAGAVGHAVTIALRQQVREVRDIEKLIGTELRVSDRSTVDAPILHRPKHNSRKERADQTEREPRPVAVRTTQPQRERTDWNREKRTDTQPQPAAPARREDEQAKRPQASKPFKRSPESGKGRFQKPDRSGPRSFHSRRSDKTQPSWGEKKPNGRTDDSTTPKSFSDRVSDIPKASGPKEFRKPKPGWKDATQYGRSVQPHAGRRPAKPANESTSGQHPAPSGRTGHRGWSGRPKARRFK